MLMHEFELGTMQVYTRSPTNGSSSRNGKIRGFYLDYIYCCTHIFDACYLMKITLLEWYFERTSFFPKYVHKLGIPSYVDSYFPKLVCFVMCIC